MMIDYQSKKDYLWLHIRDLPYFRALLRAVEARFYEGIEVPSPTLDLGCGDGHFAGIAFDSKLEIGVDPWWGPLQEAKERGSYRYILQSEGARLPFPNSYFASVVSNSVLEHIPNLPPVLSELNRVLKPGAVFIFCVPNHNFLPMLSLGKFFDKIRFRALARFYRDFFKRITRHYHSDPPSVWISRLSDAGFKVERWWHYFSPDSLRILEWGHYFGLPSWVAKLLTGRWILMPTVWNLSLTRRLVQPYYNEPPQQAKGAYTFYITRRI